MMDKQDKIAYLKKKLSLLNTMHKDIAYQLERSAIDSSDAGMGFLVFFKSHYIDRAIDHYKEINDFLDIFIETYTDPLQVVQHRSDYEVKKLYEKRFYKYQWGIVTDLADKVVICKGRTLMLCTKELKPLKKITIDTKILISKVYKKFNNQEEFLIFEEDRCLIYVNFVQLTHSIIYIDNKFPDIFFYDCYYWANDTVILTTPKDFFLLDIGSNTLLRLSKERVEKDFPLFYEFANLVYEVNARNVASEQLIFIQPQELKNSYLLIDIKHDTWATINHYNSEAYRVTYQEGIVFVITEQSIDLIYENEKVYSFQILRPFFLIDFYFDIQDLQIIIVIRNFNNIDMKRIYLYQLSPFHRK